MEIVRFEDGPTEHETWELPDAGWPDWASVADRFLAHALRGVVAAYAGDSAEWLEVNHWPSSGRVIVFPTEGGPHGDRGERVCFELSSEYLAVASRRIGATGSDPEQALAWGELSARVWPRVGECFTAGVAAAELAVARRTLKLRVAGYDLTPGEGPSRLTEAGGCAAPSVTG